MGVHVRAVAILDPVDRELYNGKDGSSKTIVTNVADPFDDSAADRFAEIDDRRKVDVKKNECEVVDDEGDEAGQNK